MAEGRIKLDLKGVSTGFEPLPRGKYLLRIAEAKSGISGKGNPKVEVTFKVVAPTQYRGRNQWAHLPATGKAVFKLKQLLLAAGYSKEDLDRDGVEIDLNELKGLEVGAQITERDDETYGKSAEIKRFMPAEDPEEYEREDAEEAETSWGELDS